MSFHTSIPSVSSSHPSHPLLVFALSTVFFSLAIQKRPGTGARRALTALQLASVGLALNLPSTILVPFNHVLAPAGLIITMDTAAVLIFDKQTLSLRREGGGGGTWWSWLRALYRVWGNPRRRRPLTGSIAQNGGVSSSSRAGSRRSTPATTAATTAAATAAATPTAISNTSSRSTARFALTRCAHAAALLGARHAAHYLASYYLLVKTLRPSAADFGPDRQGLLPLTTRDLGLRAYVAGAWLVDTYVLLVAAHDIFSAVFMWAMAWDAAEEWTGPPPLFGRVGEARSVRRFWGVFWHRLHVAVFDAYMPAVLRRRVAPPRESRTRSTMVVGALLRALWIFAMSAVLHMAANWVVVGTLNAKGELFFFLGNYVVCVVETVVGSWRRERDTRLGCPRSPRVWGWLCRMVGYAWVMWLIVCLTPGWQCPLVYAAL